MLVVLLMIGGWAAVSLVAGVRILAGVPDFGRRLAQGGDDRGDRQQQGDIALPAPTRLLGTVLANNQARPGAVVVSSTTRKPIASRTETLAIART